MGKWRDLFESNKSHFSYEGASYLFGPPATAEQIVAAEEVLKDKLPDDLRSLLSEINGIFFSEDDIFYLDLQHISVDVPAYFQDVSDPVTGNPLPPADDLKKVIFFCNSNGFGDLWGMCLEDVAGHPAGSIVFLDHEVGELETCCSSLDEFVRNGPWFD